MFGNVGNNNKYDQSINTKIKTFYSDLSCLQLTYWNESISIKINPLLSVSQDGIRQYDYNRRISTALSADKCLALKEKLEETFLPKIKEVASSKKLDKALNVGLQVGTKGSAVFFEYKNDEKGIPTLYLTIYTNVGQDGKAPKDGVFSYKFSKVTTIENYDPESGTGTDDVVEGEFLFVYEKLKSIADVCGTAAHTINSENAYKAGYTGKGNGGYSSFNNSQSSTQNTYSAPVSSFDISELPFS
jgi:hypothetical protein